MTRSSNHNWRALCALLVVFVQSVFVQSEIVLAEGGTRPNIILIMSDDMGWSDLGCYGGEVETPQLDALAAGGVRFTQFYNTGRCCPTRASLLTGLYPHQAGIGHMMNDRGLDGYRGDLNRRCVTIAEALRPVGYRTYLSGKWHVTKKINPSDESEKHNWPLQRGFDRFYGTIHGAGSFFDPNTLARDNTLISPYGDPEYQPAEFYYTDAINDHAVRFVSEHARDHADQPFFMYVSHTAPHWPMHAKAADIAKYRGKYDGGYDAIRAARFQRQQAMGLVDPPWKLAPQSGGAWRDVPDTEFELRCMEVYAAMIDCLDQGIGRIVQELKQAGQFENTVILFLQDNGGCAEAMGRGRNHSTPRDRADAPSLTPLAADFLQPDMIPKQTRDGFPMRQGYGVLPGGADTFHGYGEAWANVSNTPFREYKHWVHEGGISSPLIAHWPAGVPAARHNSLESQPAHLIDLMATCLDLAGAIYPSEFEGHPIEPMEGVSLQPALEGKSLNRPEPIFFEHEGNRAVRNGQWKLVAKGPRSPWELYDMSADRTELHDLAKVEPQRVAEMATAWEAWARRAHVIPWIWGPPFEKRLNVLFIISDDLTATALSCYGNTICETPNIDRLAARGTRFTRAFCNATYCGPSRASFLSGYYPHATGVLGYTSPRPAIGNRATWPQHFKDAGYYSARVSKIYHMGVPGGIEYGGDGRNHNDGNGADDAESWTERFNSPGPEWKAAGEGETLEGNPDGKKPVVGGNTFVVVEADGDDLVHSDGKTAAKGVELIEQHAGEPYFLALGFVRPHVPFVAPRNYFEPFLPYDKLPLPPKLPNAWADIPKAGINYKTSQNMQMDVRRQKKAVGGYYASVAFVDAQVGKVLDALERSGEADNTIVIFTSDHGYHLGEHDFWAKVSLRDESAMVPLIIHVPGKEPAVCDSIVELIDLYPTIANLCGLPVPERIQGKDFSPLFDDPNHRVRDSAFCVAPSRNGFLLRDDRWAYLQYEEDASEGRELYDVVADPRQYVNLAGQPNYRDVVSRFERQLADKLREIRTNDLGGD